MANGTYDQTWQQAMSELNDQIHVEDHTLDLPADHPGVPEAQATPQQAFDHYASVYVKYIQILRKLNLCYDNMKQPQKRIDVKKVLEAVMTRVTELKHELVKWNPPNPDLRPPDNNDQGVKPFPFPWEYVHLDDLLQDLKLQPEDIDLPIPKYFIEDKKNELDSRDQLVEGYMTLKLGTDKILVELEDDYEEMTPSLTVNEALSIIMRNERGRQGQQRALTRKRLVESESATRSYEPSASQEASRAEEMDEHTAAQNIQKVYRGYKSRIASARARIEELTFIGMRPRSTERLDNLRAHLEESHKLRKEDQQEYEEEYEKALKKLHEKLLSQEGPQLRDKMMSDRLQWYIDQVQQDVRVENLQPYYAHLQAPTEEEKKAEEEAQEEAKKEGGKKDKKGKNDKGKEKGKGKGKKGDDEEEEQELPPPLTGPSEFTRHAESLIRGYEATWLDRDESDNYQQKYDEDLAKHLVRPSVEETVRKEVDNSLEQMMKNLNKQFASKKGGKKGKKGKGKKGKGKKGKGKKGKKLPGEKECAGMDADQMLSMLVENKIVNNPSQKASVESFTGEYNYLGTSYSASDKPSQRHPTKGYWMPCDPCASQIRQNLTEYAVYPLGCESLREEVSKYCSERNLGAPPRSILLYGPRGTGKTMLAQAVANATGAMFLNLSAGNTEGKFTGKGGPAKLLHMAFMIGKEAGMGPTVIYVDEVDQILAPTGKKKVAAEGPARFKKDLPTYIKNIKPNDPIIVIGCSSEPWNADQKALKGAFDRYLYLPLPDYATRRKGWINAIEERLKNASAALLPYSDNGSHGSVGRIPEGFDISSLTQVSEGYTIGSILRTVRSTLTDRRIERVSLNFLGMVLFRLVALHFYRYAAGQTPS
eukprot:gb/GECG01013232.1/.p1 GENE.gb/GECG01013232.1/~~gb/GECG01013232.1/.p1  ORF type:complete len:875 (+),score=137.06 gb/GECG01013232.1/:1-2625(+)